MHSVGPKTSSRGTDRIPSVMAIRTSAMRTFSTAALGLLLAGAGSGCERSAAVAPDLGVTSGVAFDAAPDVAYEIVPRDMASSTQDLTPLPSGWDTCALPDAGPVPDAGWTRQLGGDGWTAIVGVAMAPNGRFYLTGNFTGTATFGRGEPNETMLTATTAAHGGLQSGADIFVAGFNPDGTLAWVKHPINLHAGTRNSGMRVATNESCGLVVVGELNDTITFGAGEPAETTLTPERPGNSDGFIARYRADGSLMWARRFGGASFGDATPMGIAIEATAGILVVGNFQGRIVFGPGEQAETTLESQKTMYGDRRDVFLARFRAIDGSVVWAQRAGGPKDDLAGGVAVSATDLFIVGQSGGSATFGSGIGKMVVNSSLSSFIARYGLDGTLVWVRGTVPKEVDDISAAWGVALFPDGSPVATGFFVGTSTFGVGEKAETTLISGGNRSLGLVGMDLYVARYRTDGALEWVRHAGDPGSVDPAAIAVTPSGTAVVTGFIESGPVTFGRGEVRETTLTPINGVRTTNGFAAGYGGDGLLKWAVNFGGPDLTHGTGAAATIDGSAIVVGFFDQSVTFGPGMQLNAAQGAGDGFYVRYRNVDDKAVLP